MLGLTGVGAVMSQSIIDIGSSATGVEHALGELEATRTRCGSCHPEVARCLSNLGVALMEERRLSEAEEAFRESLFILSLSDEPTDRRKAIVSCQLAELLQLTGRYLEAEILYRDAHDVFYRFLGVEDPITRATEERHTAVLRRMQLPS